MNILFFHPDTDMLTAEFHQVFYGLAGNIIERWINHLLYLLILLCSRQHIFWHRNLQERRYIPRFLFPYIDVLLYRDIKKMMLRRKMAKEPTMKDRDPKSIRFIAKCPNGLVFINKLLPEIYPDASFVALVRNGYAVCEGFVRRGYKITKAAKFYNNVCQRILEDSIILPNFYIVRFEDMVSNPKIFIEELYSKLKLNIKQISKIRFQPKRITTKNGTRKFVVGTKDRETFWISLKQLEKYLRPDVNENQINRLSNREKEIFVKIAGPAMRVFNYPI